jgi:MFS family permease
VNWWIAVKLPHAGADAQAVEQARQAWNYALGWRWMFTAVALPSLLFLVGALCIPESPRWLVKNGMRDRAERVLSRIGGAAYAGEAVRDIEGTLDQDTIQKVRFVELVRPGVRKLLAIGVILAVLQQWSGINSIFNYAQEIYQSAGYGVSDIMFNIVITGTINLVFTLFAIGTVDRFGRRA